MRRIIFAFNYKTYTRGFRGTLLLTLVSLYDKIITTFYLRSFLWTTRIWTLKKGTAGHFCQSACSLCFTLGLCWLPILNKALCTCQYQTLIYPLLIALLLILSKWKSHFYSIIKKMVFFWVIFKNLEIPW